MATYYNLSGYDGTALTVDVGGREAVGPAVALDKGLLVVADEGVAAVAAALLVLTDLTQRVHKSMPPRGTKSDRLL